MSRENETGALVAGGVVIAQVEHHDIVGGYEVPVDPMDELGCDSCQ